VPDLGKATSSLDTRTLSALVKASAAINGTLELKTVLDAVARSAADVMNAEAASVLLYNARHDKLVFRAAIGGGDESLLGVAFDANLGIAGKVASTSRPLLVNDVHQDSTWFEGIDLKSNFQTRSMIACPMVHAGVTIGVIEVMNPRHRPAFNDDDLGLVGVFANLAANGAANARAHEDLKQNYDLLQASLKGSDEIVGTSPALQEVLRLAQRVAPSNATVLLLGETGTGKELVARAVHANSQRGDKPLVAVNCAALTETLLESELFGHEKGAFTGATETKAGRFELADGGSLFLDEIGETSASTQVKLLRVLQEQQFVRVGGTRTLTTDVRVIAATNRDLQAEVQQGRFRADLYYRLNVFPIVMPPLRQRREDISLLAEHFVSRASTSLQVKSGQIDRQAIELLVAYDWPGNIRELQNVIERAVLLAGGETITPEHLPKEIVGAGPQTTADHAEGSLWDYEKALIVRALDQTDWNQSAAARSLGISRDNLRYRVKKYGIRRAKPS